MRSKGFVVGVGSSRERWVGRGARGTGGARRWGAGKAGEQVGSLGVNGRAGGAEGDRNAPLGYVRRNQVDAKGVRFGCGTGNCGACTVISGAHAQQSCTVPNWSVADQEVITAEGLTQHPVGAVVLRAFIDEQAAQCGYCINGILVSLTALLQKNARPDDAALRECLNRHLCRCGTHLRILRAAKTAISRLGKRE